MSITVFIIIPAATYFVFRLPVVQTWVSQKISSYISDKINTKVTLEGVDISIFDHFIFEKFYIEDQNTDTLLFVNKLAVNLDYFDLATQKIALDAIKLDNFVSHIYYDSLNVSNFQFIFDNLASSEEDTTSSNAEWKLNCKIIEITNSSFSYYVPDTVPFEYGLNYNDLNFTNFNFHAQNLIVVGNTVMVDIDSMSIKDKCGLDIKKLQVNTFINNQKIELNKFNIITSNSKLYLKKLKFYYTDFSAFDNFLTDIIMDIKISDSTILNLKDLSFFVPQMKGYKENIKLKASLKGSIDKLNAQLIDVKYGTGTHLRTSFSLSGMAEFDNLEYNVYFDTLTTSITDINSIKNPEDTTKNIFEIPENIKKAGKIFFNGNLTGNLQNIKIKGDLITGLGNILSDITITEDTKKSSYNIKGYLEGKELHIGNILENKDVGKFDFIDTLDINILKTGELEGISNGIVSNMQLYNYNYDSASFNIIINPNGYRGNIVIDDKNIQMIAAGSYITIDSVPDIRFVADIKKFLPYNLHLVEDSAFSTSVRLSGNFKGIDLENIEGKMDVDIRQFQNSKSNLTNETIELSIANKIDSSKTIILNSDFFDMQMTGNINTNNIQKSITKFICQYMPSAIDTTNLGLQCSADSLNKVRPENTNLTFNFDIKNINKLIALYTDSTSIAYDSHIKGQLDMVKNNFLLEAYSPEIIAEGIKINEMVLNGDNRNEQLSLYLNSKNIFWSETNSLDNSLLQVFVKNDSLQTDFMWNSFLDTLNYNGYFSLIAGIENQKNASPLYKIKLKPSNFAIHTNQWNIKSNEIIIDTNYIDLGEINAQSNNDEHFIVKGMVSDKVTDTLEIGVNKFNVSILNLLFEESGLKLEGLLSGSSKIVATLGELQINSHDSISNFKINDEDVGKVRFKMDWDNPNSMLTVNASTQIKKTKNLVLKGNYDIKNDVLDFKVDVTRFPFIVAQPFIQEYLTDIIGKISGQMTITGSSEKPDIRAALKFIRAGFRSTFTQAFYSFTDSVYIEKGNIRFKKMKINAGRNSYALVSGDISHKDFEDIKLDISLDAHNFLFLNTKATDTSLFYGTVFATGGIKLLGPVDNMFIDIKLKTGRGTKFYLPLSTSSEVSQNDFITFKTLDTLKIKKKKEQVSTSGITLNMDLEVTQDAIFQIIMDETVGDIIKTRGNGTLNIKMDEKGDILIYGLYTVYQGDYLFTLQNLVNKKFILEKGSTIRWYGDPYNAELNMNAVYKINKVSVYDLMVSEEYREMRTDVNCNLIMTGSLENPILRFDIEAPDAKEPIPSNIKNLPQDELNKQLLSLLLTKRFRPLPGLESSVSSGTAFSNNAFEMLSNQLSNWLSQISDDFDIGLNYTQGDQGVSDELEVALSTQLFNNRVSVNTNVGLGGSKTSTTSNQDATKIVGDVEIEVKLNKKGSLKAKVFNRTNRATEINYDQTMYTQGLGILYRKEFDTFGELFKGVWRSVTFQNKRDKKKEKQKLNQNKDIDRREEKTEHEH